MSNDLKASIQLFGGLSFSGRLLVADDFAEDWYSDVLNEANPKSKNDPHARRREIIFAICFIESYLVEWTRNLVPDHELDIYFPVNEKVRLGLVDKWKNTLKLLFENNYIHVLPQIDFSGLGTLVEYRNGLIHAKASRHTEHGPRKKNHPFPTKNDLKKRKPGWALRLATNIVLELHRALGIQPPAYLKISSTEPGSK